ncbi:MAG TPA: P-loop NTPase fold protein [Longimicrobiaceae bacterium]|nr:P-loop NTPase fold protein [Longimicrobiaceae bacterium]
MQIKLLTDAPINSAEQDQIGATRFVRRLLKPLVDWPGDEGFVLGLYGSWGSGKTSILNLLEQELSHWEGETRVRRAVPIPFNPWIYSDTEPLLLSFFGTLSAHTGKAPGLTDKERRRLASALTGMGQFIVPFLATYSSVPFLASLGSSALRLTVNKLLSTGEAEFRQARKDASEILRKLGKKEIPNRIVVLIDDLDRAQANEILAVLRVVRLIADLPNISYVLAMDHDRVREVLTANRSTSYGAEFLDKIVQVPVSVPPIPASTLDQLVKEAVASALDSAGYPTDRLFSDLHWRIVDYDEHGIPYRSTIGARIRTLRDRARLVNNLHFMLLTGDKRLDIHAADAVLISFVHTFYPDVYQRVRRNKQLLTGEGDPLLAMLGEEDFKSARKRVIRRILEGVPAAPTDVEDHGGEVIPDAHAESDRSVLHQILLLLFPNLREAERRRGDQNLRHLNRIASPHRFDRYFELEPPLGEISDEYVAEFALAFARELDADESTLVGDSLVNSLRSLSAEERSSFLDKFLFRLPDVLGTADTSDSTPMSARAELATRRLISERDLFSLEEIESILLQIVSRVAGPKSRGLFHLAREHVRIVRAALESITDPSWAMLAGAHFLKASEMSDEKAATEIAEIALRRFHPYIEAHPNVFAEMNAREASHLLWRWRDLLRLIGRDFSPIQHYLRRIIADDLAYLPAIISLFGARGSDNVPSLDVLEPGELRVSADSILGADFLVEHCLWAKSLPKGKGPQDPHGLIDQCIQLLRSSSGSDTA